jgi:hypothetical protein
MLRSYRDWVSDKPSAPASNEQPVNLIEDAEHIPEKSVERGSRRAMGGSVIRNKGLSITVESPEGSVVTLEIPDITL